MRYLMWLMALAFSTTVIAQQMISPEVHPDGRVTFRLKAPGMTNVQLHCEGVSATRMERDGRGIWSLTAGPLDPDIYAYSFVVDGLQITDPSDPLLKYNLLVSESLVHVPGPKSLPWEINDVPHGRLHRHFYPSAVAGDERDFIVYTPPGYNPASRKRYPVLYLLHGFTDDTTAWTSVGRANVILDNLIARGRARPMVVVMPLGYGTMDVVKAGWRGVTNTALWALNFRKFRETLLDEVMPRVEKDYRVRTDRRSRAIAGLSMGGTESLLVGFNALDRFAWIGAFSSGGLRADFPAAFPGLNDEANRQLRLLWIGCGRQDRLFAINRRLHEWLKSKGVRHAWVPTPGVHSFRVWRRDLAEFVPLLFKPAAVRSPKDQRRSRLRINDPEASESPVAATRWNCAGSTSP